MDVENGMLNQVYIPEEGSKCLAGRCIYALLRT